MNQEVMDKIVTVITKDKSVRAAYAKVLTLDYGMFTYFIMGSWKIIATDKKHINLAQLNLSDEVTMVTTYDKDDIISAKVIPKKNGTKVCLVDKDGKYYAFKFLKEYEKLIKDQKKGVDAFLDAIKDKDDKKATTRYWMWNFFELTMLLLFIIVIVILL